MTDKEFSQKSMQLIRNQLGGVNLSEFQDEKETKEDEGKSYDAQIAAVFHILEKDVKRLEYKQLEEIGLRAEDYRQVIFGRGTINGANLLLEAWKEAQARHLARKEDPDDKPDQTTPIGEI